MKYLEDSVLILSRINYGENDRILTVIGPKLGKQKVMAKGIRRSTSKLAGNVELLSYSKLNLVQSREGGMVRLTGAKTIEHYPKILEDIDTTMMVYEWLKTVDKLSLDGEGQDYFELLRTSLSALNEQKISPKNVNIWLYIHLISISGYTLNFTNLTDLTDGALDFDFASHQFVPSSVGQYDQAMVKLIKYYSDAENPKQVVCDEALQTASSKLLSEIIKRIA
ncbi:DNA repair protein RecO [Candidatus Saccharibacteria bacterium RIFCSPHIGHO2_12_FULL_41_12]|nr:MAG: DNA repair protein RecO [Candidatus Saccharibacteria bacterium RIFCSPHIGHO2_12_FULL_41_12]